MTQRELLEKSRTKSASLSEVLAKLESESLIVRTACESDRRQLNIELTEQGVRRASTLRQERAQFEADALSCLTMEECLQLQTLLDRLVAHWKELEKGEVSA